MAATVEQYAAAQRRVSLTAQQMFARWLLANPNATPDEAGRAVIEIVHQFAPVAATTADAWFNDVMGADNASTTAPANAKGPTP